MSDVTRKLVRFREVGSEAMVSVNPQAVRLLRQKEHGTEIVFSEMHSVHVHAIMAAVTRELFEKADYPSVGKH